MIDYPNPIPIEELNTYIKLAKSGNINARRSVILRNGRLVINLVKSFIYKHNLPKDQLSDLVQEGMISISQAIDNYEFNTKCTFISYLQFWIANALWTYVRKNKYLVHVPANLLDNLNPDRIKGSKNAKLNFKERINYVNSIKIVPELIKPNGDKIKSIFDSIPTQDENYRNYDFNKLKLSNRETQALDLILNNEYKFVDVSKIWNTSKEYVRQVYRNAIANAIHKIKPTGIEYLGETLHFHCMKDGIEASEYVECYIKVSDKIERKGIRSKFIRKNSDYIWLGTDGNEYKNVYDIPYSHFQLRRLKAIYNSLEIKLKKSEIRYKFLQLGSSDMWRLKFDSYCIQLDIKNNRSVLKLSSYLNDINTLYYGINEIKKLYQDVDRIIRRL